MKIQSLIFVYTIQIFIINSLHLLTKKFKNDIIKYIKIVKGVCEKMSDKCLTVNELFSGIGTQAFALEYMKIPHKVVGTAEIEKNAIEAYNIAHGETRNYGDISKIESLDYADLWTYSFPCFTGDTLVFTDKGYKKMIDVDTNDMVFTHKSSFKPVLKKFDNGMHEIWEIKTANVDVIRTTKNHKFYVVTRSKKWNTQTNRYDFIFSEPYWKECYELTSNDYVLSPTYNVEKEIELKEYIKPSDNKPGRHDSILKLQPISNNTDFYWILGKFIGDGWFRADKKGIVICCSKKNNESKELERKLNALKINYSKVEERTTYKYHIISIELALFCEKFNSGAVNKKLPIEIFNLKKPLLKAFIEGYLFADGCKVGNVHKITSVSRELLYGIGMCITKVYNVPFRLYYNEMPKTTVIEGRTVNQHDVYQLVFDLRENIKRTSCVYLNNNYWYKITDVKNTFEKEQVYDIEVQEDHSLVVQGLGVHNCQDLSSGGKCIGIAEKGMNAQDEHGNKIATRSGLLWEVERLLAHSCGYDIDKKTNKLIKNEEYEVNPPKYLLLENVAELVKVRRHNDHFRNWRDRLTELGYITSIAILNGKDFGIPQNRERVFCLSVRKDVYPDEVYLPSTAKVHPAKFEDFVDKEVLDYKGSLMIDPAISDYLLPAYTRDLEAISKSDKEIFTCECKSGFQDHRVGITAAPTIRHQNQHTAIFVNNQIHKLTACECWKFMGIKEEDFWKVKNNSNISNNIMCGLAGNAIVVPVLMSIFYQIYLIETRGYPIENPATVPYLTLKDNVENLNPALFD